MNGEAIRVERVARIVLNTVDADALARFYVDVLGFERLVDAVRDARPDGAAASRRIVPLRLGGVRVDLRTVAPSSHRRRDAPGWSPRFQHFAIVVSDLSAAMAALERSTAWTPITRGGPQRLPADTGGVTAFKFRDPEGHPLELLLLPDEPPAAGSFVRIDHSAISVADVARSIAFYEGLGLAVAGRTLNRGIEQERLDDIDGAVVDVVSLRLPSGAKPHVELLGYRRDDEREPEPASEVDDVLATRLVLARDTSTDGSRTGPGLLRDEDGHLIEIDA